MSRGKIEKTKEFFMTNEKTRRDYETRFPSTSLGTREDIRPLTVRVPPEIDTIVRNLPDRSQQLRKWIIEGMKRDGLLPPDYTERKTNELNGSNPTP